MVSSVLPGLAGSTDQASSLWRQWRALAPCRRCLARPMRYLLPASKENASATLSLSPSHFFLPRFPDRDLTLTSSVADATPPPSLAVAAARSDTEKTEAEQKLRLVALVVLVHGIVPGSPEPPPIPRLPPLRPPRVELDCGRPRPSPTTPSAQLHSG